MLPPLKSLPVLQSGVCHFPSLLLTYRQRAGTLSWCLLLPEPLSSQLCQILLSQEKAFQFSAISSAPGFESELLLRGEAAQSCWQHQQLCGCSGGSPCVPQVCPSMHVSFAAQTRGWGQWAAKGMYIVVGCTSRSQVNPDGDQSLPESTPSYLEKAFHCIENYPVSLPTSKWGESPCTSWFTHGSTCCTNHCPQLAPPSSRVSCGHWFQYEWSRGSVPGSAELLL